LPNTAAEWEAELSRLIDDADLRKKSAKLDDRSLRRGISKDDYLGNNFGVFSG
jgi:protein-disulfide isomerase